ncbi:hypothetical protein [Enterobacter asburiae]
MSKKMSDILSNTIKVIISFFVVLFLNKILSILRKRQLYLSCWNSLENTSVSDNACTINASIYNNGKEKEKNVVIQMPSGMECSALSCNYDYKNDSGKIIIDRVLPGKKLSLIILIEGSRSLDKKCKPKIKSEDTDGKVYLTTDIVPPSAGYLTLSGAFCITIIGVFSYLISSGADPIKAFEKTHNTLFYNDYYSTGISFNPIGNGLLTDTYKIKENEYPIELIDARRLNGVIQYKFRVINKFNYPMTVYAGYEINNSHEFWSEISKINDSVDKAAAEKKELEVYKKYHVDTKEVLNSKSISIARDTDTTIAPNSLGYLILTRNDYQYLTLDDMNVSIRLKASSNGSEYETLEMNFYSYKNKKTRAMFK